MLYTYPGWLHGVAPGVWVVDEGACYTLILVGYTERLLVYG